MTSVNYDSSIFDMTSEDIKLSDSFSSTIVFFDWDDTLYPTSFFSCHKHKDYLEKLKLLEKTIIELFKTILSYSIEDHKVYINIVTNADNGWIEQTAQTYMPLLYKYINVNFITVISAKSTFFSEKNKDPSFWKYNTFSIIIKETSFLVNSSGKKNINILSIGDSNYERQALKKIESEFKNHLCKSIKFAEMQCINVITQEIKLLKDYWKKFFNYNKSFDLFLNINKETPKSTSTQL